MTRRNRALTVFGEDLDYLLGKAGKFTLPEYADECGVNYKYILQLRTIPERRPGKLYVDLLKPFARLHTINLADSQQLSLRHRNKPLSFTECRELFPDLTEEELVVSVKQAAEVKDLKDFQLQSTKTDDSMAATGVSRPKKSRHLYPHVFVGRENELNELKISFDNAVADYGSLVMVVGEPGIGKTTICGQLMDYVHEHGGISLIGHCSEPGSPSLPYLAFIEVLSSYMVVCDDEDLKNELGFGASDIARIVPEIVDRLKVTVPTVKNADEERYRLLQSVTHFLGNIAAKQPLLLVLEDLHNADHGTLDMLKHIARNIGSKHLLIVGTYRDIEVDRTHPLSATLAELRRLPNFERIFLRGLDVTETKHMLSSILGHDIPAGLDKAVYTQTEGNPLFVEEVAYYLIKEGLSTEESEFTQPVRDMNIELKVPEGLHDVLGKRLSALSQNCNNILSMASVIGREFRLDVLQVITGLSEVEVLEAIEEAQNSAILDEGHIAGRAVTYRFSHALFHQTLYEEIIAPRRIRLHQQVARELEKIYTNRLDEHAAELTEHFSQSTDSSDLEKAVRYGEMAAKRAREVYAFGEEVRLLDQAIKVQKVHDPNDKVKMCDLLLDLLEAVFRTGDVNRVIDTIVPAAFSLAEELKDDAKAVSICIWALLSIFAREGNIIHPQIVEWGNRADRYAKPETPERVYADTIMGISKWQSLNPASREEGRKLISSAVDLARKIDDVNSLWWAARTYLWFNAIPQYSSELVHIAEELWSGSHTGLTHVNLFYSLSFIGNTFLTMGQRKKAEEVYNEMREISERTGELLWEIYSAGCNQILLCYDGRFEETLDSIDKIRARAEENGLLAAAVTASNATL
ncbi:MAG TPA: AAA family ATPase, partial [Dehalococcoidia bacterium]|nr:AAA family ATPase [Dehalococcoidia bacterium]